MPNIQETVTRLTRLRNEMLRSIDEAETTELRNRGIVERYERRAAHNSHVDVSDLTPAQRDEIAIRAQVDPLLQQYERTGNWWRSRAQTYALAYMVERDHLDNA